MVSQKSLYNVRDYELFAYHSEDMKRILNPVSSKLDKNLKGVELEIDNIAYYYGCGNCDNCDGCSCDLNTDEYSFDVLESAMDDGVILTYDTMDYEKKDYNIVASYDGSVNLELGFQANQQRNILKMLSDLNKYGLNKYNFSNSRSTSCHIHNNMQYIVNNGGNLLEMQRASEFMLGVLYRVSGRDEEGYGWARGRRNEYAHRMLDKTMLDLANDADNITSPDTRTHSIVCNGQHSNTAEIRIFSNFYNFDYDLIKTYMEITDHIIDIACYMNGRSYYNEFDTLIEWTLDFCNGTRRRRNSLKQFHLEDYILPKKDLEIVRFNNVWNGYYNELENIENSINFMNTDEQVRQLLRFIKKYNLRFNTQLQFGRDTYFYKVDTTDIREALNEQYTNARNNL